jgi:hypothetical protein
VLYPGAVETRCEGPDIVKWDEGASGERLRAEADMLRRAAHPGVVQLRGSGPTPGGGWSIRLLRVDGQDLREPSGWSLEEGVGFGVAAATTVADLHDLGIVHRRLTADHLLVDERGRPVLCGFARAVCADGPMLASMKAEDTALLARSIREHLPHPLPRRLARILDRAGAPSQRRPPTARQLAGALATAVPGNRLPDRGARASRTDRSPRNGDPTPAGSTPGAGPCPVPAGASPDPSLDPSVGPSETAAPPGSPAGDARRPPLRSRSGVVVAAAMVMVASTLVAVVSVPLLVHPSSPSGRRKVATGTTVGCPRADEGCGPVKLVGSILTTPAGTFRIGGDGDVVVLGRWTCRAIALPALLQSRTGRVWIFNRWATATAAAVAEPVGTVPGARSLRVVPGRRGCDGLATVASSGRSVTLDLPRS